MQNLIHSFAGLSSGLSPVARSSSSLLSRLPTVARAWRSSDGVGALGRWTLGMTRSGSMFYSSLPIGITPISRQTPTPSSATAPESGTVDAISESGSSLSSHSSPGTSSRTPGRTSKPRSGPPSTPIGTLIKRTLHVRRVARVTKGGKSRTLYALVVVGNGNGVAGYGEGRGLDGSSAVAKATRLAIKNMRYIDRYDGRTVYSDVRFKYHCTEIEMFAVPPGYGLVANPHVHEIMRCAGIRDLACNVRGSMNPMNVIKGTFEALATQKTPEDVARMRGKKVVDVRQAYYGAAA